MKDNAVDPAASLVDTIGLPTPPVTADDFSRINPVAAFIVPATPPPAPNVPG